MKVKKINKILMQYEEVLSIATILFKSRKEALAWMHNPTDLLFGDSPTEAILAGEGKIIIEWLNERS